MPPLIAAEAAEGVLAGGAAEAAGSTAVAAGAAEETSAATATSRGLAEEEAAGEPEAEQGEQPRQYNFRRRRSQQLAANDNRAPSRGLTWLKASVFIFPVTVINDLLRLICVFLVFELPFIAGSIAAAYASASGGWVSYVPSWVVGVATSVGVGTAEIFIPGAAEGIDFLGVVLAIVIGLFGFILTVLILAMYRVNFFSPMNTVRLGLAFIGVVLPFVDAFPLLTLDIFFVVRDQIEHDEKVYQKYLKNEQERLDEARNSRIAEARERQAYLLEAANDDEQEAANDNDEIPEESYEAA